MPRSALFAAALLPALALAVAGPGQLSLAVTANGPTEMAVTWASLIAWTPAATANVSWWPTAQPQAVSSAASWRTQTYTAGFGWTGTLFAATMTGLVPGASYSYSVTDATGNASAATTFHAAPAPAADAAVRIGVLADMGTIELMGWDVAALGLPHAGLPFANGTVLQHIEIPGLWLERGRIAAADTRLLHSPLGLAGHNCIATLFFCSGSPLGRASQNAALDAARACIDSHPLAASAGATGPNPQVVVVRVLAPQVEAAMELLRAIRVAWRAELWQLGAGVPRIWAM